MHLFIHQICSGTYWKHIQPKCKTIYKNRRVSEAKKHIIDSTPFAEPLFLLFDSLHIFCFSQRKQNCSTVLVSVTWKKVEWNSYFWTVFWTAYDYISQEWWRYHSTLFTRKRDPNQGMKKPKCLIVSAKLILSPYSSRSSIDLSAASNLALRALFSLISFKKTSKFATHIFYDRLYQS